MLLSNHDRVQTMHFSFPVAAYLGPSANGVYTQMAMAMFIGKMKVNINQWMNVGVFPSIFRPNLDL